MNSAELLVKTADHTRLGYSHKRAIQSQQLSHDADEQEAVATLAIKLAVSHCM